jgi:hypothetical protein
MSRRSLRTGSALALVLALATAARAQEGFVLKAQDRRPPQASPAHPSANPAAPPDLRQLRRAVSGLIGGLAGFTAASFAFRGASPEHQIDARVASVSIGIGLGVWLGGR